MPELNALVALTDRRWYEYLDERADDGRLDEVNFWRPRAQTVFRALSPGEPLFFRLHHPMNAIVGYGFFAAASRIPIALAWEAFGQANGAPTEEAFLDRIAEYRQQTREQLMLSDKELACVILREARFLPPEQWLSWGEDREWSPNIVSYKTYDLTSRPGAALAEILANGRPPELGAVYEPVSKDTRVRDVGTVVYRAGQGTFRVRVLDAYARRCAVTGEKALPVLDAAHIQPYLGPQSNHIQNGLALRSDIHRLYDSGYATITPDYRFEVSSRLKEDFENGEFYFTLRGKKLEALPRQAAWRPSPQALEWHASNVFH